MPVASRRPINRMVRLEDSRPDAFATDMPEIYRSRPPGSGTASHHVILQASQAPERDPGRRARLLAVALVEVGGDGCGVFVAQRRAIDLDHLVGGLLPGGSVLERRIHHDVVEAVAHRAARLC